MHMADLQFQDPQYGPPVAPRKVSWVTSLVIKAGLAADEASAQKALLIILVIVILAIIAIWTL